MVKSSKLFTAVNQISLLVEKKVPLQSCREKVGRRHCHMVVCKNPLSKSNLY